MKSSEVDFKFPVPGFAPDREIWGFPDLDRLTKCGPRTLKENAQDGVELVDAEGRRWRIQSVRRLSRAGSILSSIFFGPPQSRIEQELEPLPPISLAEVQQRARAAMELQRADYYGAEGQAEFRRTIKKVERARSIAKIYDVLQRDTFEPH